MRSVCTLLSLTLWSQSGAFAWAAAAEPDVAVKSAHLVVEIDDQIGYLKSKARQTSWEAACNALGKSLVENGDGPWGFGPFSDYRCSTPEETYGRGPGESRWGLTVTPLGSDGRLALKLAPQGSIGAVAVGDVAASLKLGEAMAALEVLANPELARRIAATLTDSLPMLTRVRALAKGGKRLVVRYPAQIAMDQDEATTVPPPPKRLNFYELRWDSAAKLWRPRIVGSGKLGKVVKPKDDEGKVGKASYALDAAVIKALAAGPLWAHDSRGTGANSAAWAAATKALHAEIAEAQADRLSSPLVASAADVLGFVGVRYGKQILSGNKLLESSSFIGLLVEVRAGPLSGLQYYYDVLPATTYAETSVTDQSVDSEIAWSRHVLGYTFRVPFPWLIDRVTLTPKLGIWTLKAKIPGDLRDDLGRIDELREFNIDNALSAGAEVGLEYLKARFAIRPWAGVDTSFAALGEGSSVTSRRVGVDLYVAGPSFTLFAAPVRVALLGFSFIENVALSNVAPETQDVVAGEDGVRRTVARKIEYNAGYAGIGLALSW